MVFDSLTNVLVRDTIGAHLTKEEPPMKAMVFTNSNSFSCSTAAAGSSAYMIPILDTAVILAVSICILALPLLRIMSLTA